MKKKKIKEIKFRAWDRIRKIFRYLVLENKNTDIDILKIETLNNPHLEKWVKIDKPNEKE